MRRAAALLAAELANAVPGLGLAQAAFPSRPVTLVVPFTPNSGSDIIARIVGPKLQQRWGQPVVVDNRPGASGNLGSAAVAKAPADGHTLLMAINTFSMTPWIYKSLPFDPVADFAPVIKLAEAGFVLGVNSAVPAKDLPGLLALARKTPGKLNFATPGNGTPQHLAMELLKDDQRLDIVHVPYKGIAGALGDLMGGQVQMMFATLHAIRPAVQTGKVRLLAVAGAQRHALAPDVPTFQEQGLAVMDTVDAWYGVFAPARTPPELVQRLNADFAAVMNSDDVRKELAAQGLTVHTGTPAQFASLVKADLQRWRKVIQDAQITAD